MKFRDNRLKIGDEKGEVSPGRLASLCEELSSYLQKPIEDIAEEYWQLRQATEKGLELNLYDSKDEKFISDYYKNTTRYFYELMYWEAHKNKYFEFKKLLLFLKKFNLKNILDFGGGVGSLPIYLKKHGIKCDYYDLPSRTSGFARWRFERRGGGIAVIDRIEEASLKNKYDAIVAYDVLEHLFDLEGAAGQISVLLKDDGFLLSHSAFSGGRLHLKKNEKYMDLNKFNHVLSMHGLSFVGQLKPDKLSRLINKIGLGYFIFSIRFSKRLKHGGNFLVHRKSK